MSRTPGCKIDLAWSPNLAYAIGLIVTDGNLSSSGRHINLTSKDIDLIETFKKCLKLDNKIGRKARGGSPKEKKYFVLQFGDVNFYRFLLSIGLMQRKSKIMQKIDIPEIFFPDFLRGCIDGDGNISLIKHPESKHLQLRVRLTSASPSFASWILKKIKKYTQCKGGWIYKAPKKIVYNISFGKEDSIKILNYMYYNGVEHYLKRKYIIAARFLGK